MRRLPWLILILWAVLASPAAADVFDDNPATASRGPGDQWVFARASSGEILERHLSAGAWTAWASVGGVASSGPAAVAYGGSIFLFVRGQDGALYQNTYGTGWSGWESLGGYLTSAPAAAVRRGLNYLDVVVRGSDNSLVFRSFVPGTGWYGWDPRGGSFTSGPTIASYADGQFNLWARGTDAALKSQGYTGSAWTDWVDMGGGIVGAPAAVSRASPWENVYARGGGDQTYVRSWDGSAWSPWNLLDSRPIESSPAAAGDGPDHEWLFARGGSGLLYKEWRAASGWSAWSDFGPIAVPVPPVVPVLTPTPPAADGEVSLTAGVRCTPPGGKARVSITIRRAKGKPKPRVSKIVFFTKGKGRRVRVDRRSPFVVRIAVNRPAGAAGRVYARVYFRRTPHGPVHRKTVSRRYEVCR